MSHKRILTAALAAALSVGLTGCSAKAPMSKTEEVQFKGGPMPEDARKIMQQKIGEARDKAAAASKAAAARSANR
jgi:hypothetical protein